MIKKYFLVLALPLVFSSCAVLHHVQVGSIDNRTKTEVLIPFEILMSEMGASTEEIGALAKASNSDAVRDAAVILALFQFGPRTGNIVYNETYAQKLIYEIHQKCPTGKVTGLISIREMRKYPVISGEIVKVTGFCKKMKSEGNPS